MVRKHDNARKKGFRPKGKGRPSPSGDAPSSEDEKPTITVETSTTTHSETKSETQSQQTSQTPSESASVDSKGNIKGLIDYDYDSSESSSSSSSSSVSSRSSTSNTESEKSNTSPVANRTRSKKQSKKGSLPPARKRSRKTPTSGSDSESIRSSSSESSSEKGKKTKRKQGKSRIQRKNTLHRLSTGSTTSDEDDDEEEDEDYDGSSDDESGPGIILSFGLGGNDDDPKVPKRHNMKKESEDVKKFVKLLTTEHEENTIDSQIDQYKALTEEQKQKLLLVLERTSKAPGQPGAEQSMMFKILTSDTPEAIQTHILNKYNALQRMNTEHPEYEKLRCWLEKAVALPLGLYREVPVKIGDGPETCGAFMEKARKHLDSSIYGQEESKLQILQFIAAKIANPNARGTSLLLAGPPGIGKTSLIKMGVAKALDWPFQFISLGGDSDATTYTGHQFVYEGSHCGKIANSVISAKSMSFVLMFDEVDKISTTNKGEEVQNLLIHLTDPVQNGEFEDKYLAGIPLDLSRVMFTFSANYLERIDKVLLDRMTVIHLKGYTLKEKVAIAEQYLLPQALKEVDLAEKVGINAEILTYIVEQYGGEEVGVRDLKRCIEQVVQKINMLRLFNSKELPFHVKDFTLPFVVKKEHIDLFLKKKGPEKDVSYLRMYC
jgi:ATP-dependent Lon protease